MAEGRSALLGTEAWPGAGRGHAARLSSVAALLEDAGWRTIIVQPPEGPGLPARRDGGGDATFAETLAGFGLADPGGMCARMEAWLGRIGAVVPDLVIGDLAPHLMLAARGAFPTIAIGNGFFVPPPDLSPLPVLPGLGASRVDQEALLAGVNACLLEFGRSPAACLSAAVGGDRALALTPDLLDPYAGRREGGGIGAIVPPGLTGSGGGGQGIVAYASGSVPVACRIRIAEALEAVEGERVAILPGLPGDVARRLVSKGIEVREEALPLSQIAARARLVVHSGGFGLAAAMLAAGVPQLSLHTDGEKSLTAEALVRAGVGRALRLDLLPGADVIAAEMSEAAADEDLARRARQLARHRWSDPRPAILAACEALVPD
ncbi:hypothetical protein RM543_16760 [Roseicyclus sp. F158]|uniref:Erythromycin biosynthesis protein CIII-like C-terminal domain-containing protein n=1 Tax=Tropicimonas omnivorans TaxID=3075590 RepID=A0ABU3DKZ1_9RHOB|nr:nucleotide disphospho-sugar-binding domain-containing protein [Roseicyclus sp. F158]MDT0684336.1 hypothetical protein [Roseicyclus sp. F158]